ncbi:VCBS domain-containing protein [Kiloniella laminariae]|uniref:VCBS domain-containing protein n=1 Tax=Kiloniella laminariae TaxID=454162 RepID=A0ABT4LPL0_9PROT|nr:VCBS domain-containing protein [Kiloniella laminariae]MCZ4283053.1 VCBS domain-containing protein [Kiloniella laminariae]
MLTFTGVASLAQYQALLGSVGYCNSSITPDQGQRSVSFQITDDHGATSNEIIKLVNVYDHSVTPSSNLAPVIDSADTTGSAIEIADGAIGENVATHTASGSIVFNDANTMDSHSISFAPVSAGYLGSFMPVLDQASKTITWDFSVADAAIDYLAAGETLTQSYTVTINDGNGGIVNQDITITIAGTNDAPVITDNNKSNNSGENEVQVNSYTAGEQYAPSIAGLPDGGWIIVWESQGQNGSSYGVHGQAYNAEGSPQGQEFQIHSISPDTWTAPVVAGLSSGGWVVTWHSYGQDGNNLGVSAQIYNADGSPQGSQFQVNSYAAYWQGNVAITDLNDGGWVITWNSYAQDGSSNAIIGQAYNADGSKQGTEFQINSYISGDQIYPSVSSLSDGGWVVTWQSNGQDGSNWGIYGQAYNGDGSLKGTEFQVNSYTASAQHNSSVTGLSDGGWVVTWDSEGQDGANSGIFGQTYNADGTTQGSEFQVNSYSESVQDGSSVTALNNGGWVVAWESYAQDGALWGLFARIYDANGTPQGIEFQINRYTPDNQYAPSVSALTDGGFVVAWQSNGQDGSGNGIFSQSYNADGSVRIPNIYTEGGSALQLFTDIDISDVDTADDVVSATLTVTDFVAGDQLDLNAGYNLPAGITFNYNGVTGVLTLSGAASAADYEAVIEHITYNSTSDYPDVQVARTIELTVNDGSDNSNVIAKTINIVGVNDAPIVTGGVITGTVTEITDGLVDENVITHTTSGSIVFADPETVDTHSISFTSAAAGYLGSFTPVLDQASKTVTWDFSVNDAALDYLAAGETLTQSYTVTINDGNGGAVDQDVTIIITGTNDAPVITDNSIYDTQVNTHVIGNQYITSVASLADAGWVISWTSKDQDGSSHGIYGQAYNPDGTKQGSEFQINSFTNGDQLRSSITGLPDGGWVVTWDSFNQDGDSGGIYGQAFNSDGTSRGTEFRVNSHTSSYQLFSSVTDLADGGWLVSWNSYSQDGSDLGVYGQAYNPDGSKQGSEFRVNTTTANGQLYPSATGLDDGGWIITWSSQLQDGSLSGIYAQVYNADGSVRGSEFQINSHTLNDQLQPAVSGLEDGGWIITWESNLQDLSGNGVFSQAYNLDGTKQGNEVLVNSSTVGDQSQPSVAGLTDGSWVITWRSNGQDGDGWGVYGQVYNSDGTKRGVEFQINDYVSGNQSGAVVTSLSDGGFVITWDSEKLDGSGWGVFSKVYNADGTVRSSYTEGGSALQLFTDIAISDVDTADDVVSATLTVTDFVAGDQLDLNAGYNLPAGITFNYNGVTGVLTLSGAASAADYEAVIEHITYSSTSDYPDVQTTRTLELTVNDGTDNSNVISKTINIVGVNDAPVLSYEENFENRANTTTTGVQDFSSVAGLSDGGWVITWQSDGQDGSSYGIFGQAYAANGAKIGAEFQVNSYTAGVQGHPEVTSLTNGGWVVVWHSEGQDGSNYGVYGQAYNADGTPQGTEFRSNTYTSSYQTDPSVSGLPDGGWIITWNSWGQDGSEHGVYGQIYNADGSSRGNEFKVSTHTSGLQWYSAVETVEDGGWVVSWRSYNQDGSDYGVYSQAFNADGSKQGSEFRVNSYTAGAQFNSKLTGLSDGGWLTTWQSNAQEGSSWNIYQQRYDASGTAVGEETRINSSSTGTQLNADVTSLDDGGWVVVWQGEGPTGDGHDIYVQIFNADGSRRGTETQVNDYILSTQGSPSIDSLSNGGWIISWKSYEQDGSHYGVYYKTFNADGTTYSNYIEGGDTLSLFENVTIIDNDASDDIGSITATITDFVAGDQLALTTGYSLPTGVILTYDNITGVLVISGSASWADYTTIIENITYRSTSDFPDVQSTRNIELVVNDGADDSNIISKIINIIGTDEIITGDDDANTLTATSDGGASLSGLLGDDILYGAAGDDILLGGGGNDTLSGNAGADLLTGGTGADNFIFNDISSLDQVTDFSLSDGDVLNIADLIDFSDTNGDIISNYLSVTSNGDTATLSISNDGGVNFAAVATLDNISTGDTLRIILDESEQNILVI